MKFMILKKSQALPAILFGLLGAFAPLSSHVEAAGAFEKFVDPLPIPPVVDLSQEMNWGDTADLTMTIGQFQTSFHRDLPPSPSWGYNGSSPGPTIIVAKGQKLRVHWQNQLPMAHIFKLPAGLSRMCSMPDVRTVTHLHGAVVEQPGIQDRVHDNDGWPDAWIVPGQEQISEYPNDQDARMLWYHDHAMASTGRNVAAGLVGAYLIRDDFEQFLNLPSGDYEVPLILQAMGFNGDGSRYYTTDISNEFYGNTVAVNGKLWPYMNVEPRKYRFRILNASNARAYAMKLVDLTTHEAGPAIYQIGTDGGFLDNTLTLNDPGNPDSPRLNLAPAERADVIIDFSQFGGKNLLLQNNSLDPGDGEMPLPQIMLFKVGPQVLQPDTSSLPMQLRPIPAIPPETAVTTRRITLQQTQAGNMQMMLLNGKSWSDPITETPILGTTEIWELVNTTTSMHPFHIHLVNFQVLDNRPFDLAQYGNNGQITYAGAAQPPDPNQVGWKDVVQVQPGTVTRIIMTFGPYAGYYVYHCHILEHEDMDMMRPFQIVSPYP
ncbi:MAG: multicopper oxidase domain-containing protein [Oligoflexia bacterium]|nr:multicopper oxidase domain-containing protein [Oligoflexia bacterium]